MGSGGVGKSAITIRFVNRHFEAKVCVETQKEKMAPAPHPNAVLSLLAYRLPNAGECISCTYVFTVFITG